MTFKKILYFLFLPFLSYSQGHEWISFDQDYVKITIEKDGFYELSAEDLTSHGLNLENTDPKFIQVFLLGQEIAISILGEEDGSLDAGDKILFYAEANKGELDSLVYRPATNRMNADYSLFSGESAYFLTIGESHGKRMVNNGFSSEELTDYHLQEQLQSYTSQFSFNNIIGLLPNLQQSYYEEGEGRTGDFLSSDSTSYFTLQADAFKSGTGQKSKLEFQLNGRSWFSHKILYSINGVQQLDTLQLGGFSKFEKSIELEETDLGNGFLNISFTPIAQAEYDWFSVTKFKLTYPKLISDDVYIYSSQKSNFSNQGAEAVLDISDKWSVSVYELVNEAFTANENAKNLLVRERLLPKEISKTSFSDFSKEADFVILTDESLLPGAEAYAAYRSSVAGGDFTPLIVSPSDVYDQFTFGHKSPVAIRRFADFIKENNQETKHLFLLGRAVTFPDELRDSQYQDLVPSFGYPGSDVLLTAGTGGEMEDVQGFSTGRLNVTTNEEILAYLNKVKETEAAPIQQTWKKNMLHLSGGKNVSEISALANLLDLIKPKAEAGLLGGNVGVFRKQSLEEIEAIDISEQVNQGVGMITFAGHGSANIIDLNIGYCSPEENGYNNKGKYPIMFFNGCGVGNVFYRYDPLTTDWLLTPDKGAIAIFANSFWSYLFPTQVYLNVLYEKLFEDPESVGLSLGEIQQAVNRELSILNGNPYIKANMHQMVLQGDPAIKMFALQKADFSTVSDAIEIQSTDVAQSINESDSIWVQAALENHGRFDASQNITITLEIEHESGTQIETQSMTSFARADSVKFKIKNYSGIARLSLSLNADKVLDEYSFENNDSELKFDNWAAAGVSNRYPTSIAPDNVAPLLGVKINGKQLEDGDYIASLSEVAITLIDESSLENAQVDLVSLFLINNGQESIVLKNQSLLDIKTFLATANLDLKAGTYELLVKANDLSGNEAKEYRISFIVSEATQETNMLLYPNPVLRSSDAQISYQIIAPKAPENAELSVYNALGQIVYSEPLKPSVGKNLEVMPVKSLGSGTYSVRLLLDWGSKEDILVSRLVIL